MTTLWPDLLEVHSVLQQSPHWLLNGGAAHGVFASGGSDRPVDGSVDFGASVLADWTPVESAPKGYEGLVDLAKVPRTMTRRVQLRNVNPAVAFRLIKFMVVPFTLPTPDAAASDGGPTFSLVGVTLDEFKGPMLIPGYVMQLTVECTVPGTFDGHLGNRFLCFAFESAKRVGPTCLTRTNFFLGLQVRGVVRKAAASEARPTGGAPTPALSVDAKKFIPLANMILFDEPVDMVYDHEYSQLVPNNYKKVVEKARRTNPIPDGMTVEYFHASKRNAVKQLLEAVMTLSSNGKGPTIHGVVGDVRGRLTSATQLASADPTTYLESLACMTHCEECQCLLDISQYDLVTEKLKWKTTPDKPGGSNRAGFQGVVDLKVVGSNESRPKILLGDIVRLRPAKHALPKAGSHTREYVGRIINFKLKTELVQIEVTIDAFFKEVKAFNVRFTFERAGLSFVHSALRRVRSNEYLSRAIFPAVDDAVTAAEYSTILRAVNANIRRNSDFDGPHDGTGSGDGNGDGGGGDGKNGIHFNCEQLQAVRFIAALPAPLGKTEVMQRVARLRRQGLPVPSDKQVEELAAPPGRGAGDAVQLPPFIVQGPPGTGKTSTIIRAIEETRRRRPELRILACAPSDAAADVIALRLVGAGMTPAECLRLNWFQRTLASVPGKLLQHCYQVDGMFELPSVMNLAEYAVVVCTCGTAGAIGALLDAHPSAANEFRFDVVIVDEASQATEAETFVPLSLCRKGGAMVLAGDPQQLSASSRSPIFSLGGFARSLQERLMGLPLYDCCRPKSTFFSFSEAQLEHQRQQRVGAADVSKAAPEIGTDAESDAETPGLGVFLTKNYRSHRSIFEVSSRLFYGGRLEQYASPEHLRLEGLSLALAAIRAGAGAGAGAGTGAEIKVDGEPTDTVAETASSKTSSSKPEDCDAFPVLFVGIDGLALHEMDSPSFYNDAEIDEVVRVTKAVLKNCVGVDTRDFGVICAFRAQVLRMRVRLRAEGLGAINVGSVEDFQGQETRIIVISTVLTKRMPTFEVNGVLGLTGDHRRFNVAVTRGMALCVVVGQPSLLYTDPVWREFLDHCDSHGAYCGCPCPLLRSQGGAETGTASADTPNGLLGAGHATDAHVADAYCQDHEGGSPTKISFTAHNDSEWRVIL